MSNKNEIRGGSSKSDAYVICDWWDGNVHEMSEAVASELGRSHFHRWVEVYDIRTNKDVQERVKKIPKITNEAIHALEMANLRGVKVHLIYFDEELRDWHIKNEERYMSLYKAVSFLSMKDWEKVHKILLKNGFDISNIYDCGKP